MKQAILRESVSRDGYLHFAVIKMLQPERRMDVYINSHPFAVSNYKDVASNGLWKEEQGRINEGRGLLNTSSPYHLYIACV